MKKYILPIIILIFFIFLCSTSYFFIFRNYYQQGAIFSPDFSQVNFFSEKIIQTGHINVPEPLNNEIYPIFGSRSMRISPQGDLVPGAMLGQILTFSLFKIVSENSTFLINPLFALGSLIMVYLISKKLFQRSDIAFISVILVMFFSAFINYSIIPYNNVISLFFSLLCLFYFFKVIDPLETKKTSSIGLLSFFLGVVFIFRYPDALILSTSIFIVLMVKIIKKEFKLDLKTFSLGVVLFLIPFIFFMIINKVLLGKYLVFGNANVPTLLFNQEGRTKIFGILFFDGINVLVHNLLYFIILTPIAIFIPFVIARKKAIKRDHLILIGCLLFFYTILYLGTKWTGSAENFFGLYSLTRYLLPFYVVLIILVSKGLSFFNRKFLVPLIFLYIAVNAYILVNSPSGLKEHVISIKKFASSQNNFITKIPENGIVFTAYNDKFIFPLRKTVIYSSVKKDQNLDVTAKTALALVEKGYDVYFLDEDFYPNKIYNLNDYKEKFSIVDLDIVPTDDPVIYKITWKNVNPL